MKLKMSEKGKQRALSWLLILAMVITLIPMMVITSYADEEYTYGDFTYSITPVNSYTGIHLSDVVNIVKCNTKAESIAIPSYINDNLVTKIESGAFSECKNLQSILLLDHGLTIEKMHLKILILKKCTA